MKFSRIFAMFMFAAALTGSMPVQAEGIFDWLAGLFEDKAKPARQQGQPMAVPRPPVQQPRNNVRGGKHNRRHNRRHNRNNPARQPVMQEDYDVNEPRVRTTNPRAKAARIEKIKNNLSRNVGLIAVGIVISAAAAVLLNPAAQQKIRDILGYARPAQDVNNLFRDVKDTAKDVKDFAKNIMDTLSGDEQEAQQA